MSEYDDPANEGSEWADFQREIERWNAAHPNACKSCGGWGVTSYRESVPYGSTTASFDVNDPCEQCVGAGKCGRCGAATIDPESGDGPCSACGWDYDDGSPEK